MQKSRFMRVAGLAMIVIGLMAMSSASALGAGKPTNVVAHWETYTSYGGGINYSPVKAHANPNGAATTIQVEYHDPISEKWLTLLTKEIGSGTENVFVSTTATGLRANTAYMVRATATNSYGTTVSYDEYSEKFWFIEKEGAWDVPSSFSAEASLSFVHKFGSSTKRVECQTASGFGTLGHEQAEGDFLFLSAEDCSYYLNDKYVCTNPQPLFLEFDNRFQTSNLTFQYCKGEEVEWTMSLPNPFSVSAPPEAAALTQPVTLTGSGSLGGWPVTMTIPSTWALSGALAGHKFTAYADVG